MQGVREHTEGSGEVTGVERLQGISMAFGSYAWGASLSEVLGDIADQIKREHAEDCFRMGERAADVSMSAYDLLPDDERDAIAWVREHGGIAYVRDAWRVRSNLDRQLKRAQAKVERQQRHIEFVQRKCRERRERIEELNRELDELDDICGGESVKDTLEEALNLCATIGCEPSSAVGEELVWTLGECTDIVSKRLMPEGMEWLVEAWPRFEDVEPVRVGDEVPFGEDGTMTVTGVELTDGGHFILHGRDGGIDRPCQTGYQCGQRVKRPAPKVLDADGSEIREKCDVWWICEGDERGIHAERLRVETIGPGGLVECSPYNGGTWVSLEPSELYVNKPVPASDGRPLREGDTVLDADGRGPLTVWRLPDKSDMYVSLKKDGTFYYRYPDQLTHERPDSWERLEEDCAKSDVDYCAERGLLDPSCDAVEGDESSRHCTDCGCTCGEKMARDIVRRAKALAGDA